MLGPFHVGGLYEPQGTVELDPGVAGCLRQVSCSSRGIRLSGVIERASLGVGNVG